jgi:multidrug efflux pump subunit AcrB
MIEADPDVDRVFERIYVGSGYLNIVLKKDRTKKSSEFSRKLAPQLAAMPDAQVTIMAQNGGGPGGNSRDIMLFLGSEDPLALSAAADKISEEMQSIKELRAPRVAGEQVRPEISIKPHFDLAAQLGVTTARYRTARCRLPCRCRRAIGATSRRSKIFPFPPPAAVRCR